MDHEKVSGEKIVTDHILVGLSSSPSNAKIVRTAARMAAAFGARFTALYVETPGADKMSEENKKRLENNTRLAQKLGAELTTVYGEDVSHQIAEFARTAGATKVVVGRSSVKRRHFWSKPTLTERLTEIAPNLDIYIIPDVFVEKSYKMKNPAAKRSLCPSLRDMAVTFILLVAATLLGVGCVMVGLGSTAALALYLLGVFLTALLTRDYVCSIASSILGLGLWSFLLLVAPAEIGVGDINAFSSLLIFFVLALVIAGVIPRLSEQAHVAGQYAFQTRVLFDTDQLLKKAKDENEIMSITASQLMKLLNRDIIAYPEINGSIGKGYISTVVPDAKSDVFFSEKDRAAAEWAMTYKARAGAFTETLGDANCIYVGVRANNKMNGVVGINLEGKPLSAFEESILMSVLGGCALAIEHIREQNAHELSIVLEKSEKLRANLLQAISNDFYKPLDYIYNQAGRNLSDYALVGEEKRKRAFHSIAASARSLMEYAKNLQLVTRLEEGNMDFNMSYQLVDDVIKEAIAQVDIKNTDHEIELWLNDGLLFVNMDHELILRVIVNIIDNAVKFSPAGSKISISASQNEDVISVSIADEGEGIPDNIKPYVFDMFFTGVGKTGKDTTSIGLGLSLCKSIIQAHGGEISLTDNTPNGSIFTFTLPLNEEMNLEE